MSNLIKDNSAQIIDNIKWFMFNDQDSVSHCVNEFGFSHELRFVAWNGDSKSFVVEDTDGDKYCITINKEN